MAPELRIGDKILVNMVIYRFQSPKRGDVILFPYPLNPKKLFLKRIIGLPNEQVKIADGKVYINGQPMPSNHKYLNVEAWQFGKTGQVIQIPSDSYFVLGDNSAYSADSRQWGFVKKKSVKGKVVFIFSPENRRKKIS